MALRVVNVVLDNHDNKYEVVRTEPEGFKSIIEEAINNHPFFMGVEIGAALEGGIHLQFEVE